MLANEPVESKYTSQDAHQCICYRVSCTVCLLVAEYLRRRTRPYTYICSASAQKAELKVVGGLGAEDVGWGRGKCASLYTGSSV